MRSQVWINIQLSPKTDSVRARSGNFPNFDVQVLSLLVRRSPTEEEKCAPLRSNQIKAASASIWGPQSTSVAPWFLLSTRDLRRLVHNSPLGILALMRRKFNHPVNLQSACYDVVSLHGLLPFGGCEPAPSVNGAVRI